MIRRRRIALLPRLCIAAIRSKFLAAFRTVAETLARTSVPRAAVAVPWCAAREFLVAAKFPLGTIATGTITIRPIALRPGAVLAEAFAVRWVGPLLATPVPRRVRFFVAEFPVGETRGGPRVTAVGAGRAIVAVIVRAIAARRIRTLFTIATRGAVVAVGARRRAVTFAGIGFARAGIRLLAKGFGAVGLAGIGAPFAVVTFAGKAALGEFLVGTAGGAGAALAAGGPITPAAGIVVFIVIAGHEWSLV